MTSGLKFPMSRAHTEVVHHLPELESLSLQQLELAELQYPDTDVPVLLHGLRFTEFEDVCRVSES